MRASRAVAATLLVAALALVPAAPASGATSGRLKRQMTALLEAKGGPPGVIVTIRRGRQTTVLSGGRGLIGSNRRPRFRDHMRLASVAKAFNGAVALRLVGDRRLSLNDTLGKLRPDLPAAWHGVTRPPAAQPHQRAARLHEVPAVLRPAGARPGRLRGSPSEIVSWVARDPLDFPPGARYGYSNTDNVVIGLIAERVTGRSYASLLRSFVFRRLRLNATSFPSGTALPGPFIHGYSAGGRRLLHRPQHADQRIRGVGLGRSGVDARGTWRVHPRQPRRTAVPAPAAARPAALRARRQLRPSRPGHQLRGPRHLQLPHQVRDDVRPHRQLPGLRAVRRGLPSRDPLGHLVDQRRAARRSAASCWPSCARCSAPWSVKP